MIKELLFILLCFVLYSCKSTTVHKENFTQPIKGDWTLITTPPTINYPSIAFKDSNSAVFSSFGDTVYYFNYNLRDKDLILTDEKNRVSHNVIIKLTKDSLIFKSLLEHTTQQVYIISRKN